MVMHWPIRVFGVAVLSAFLVAGLGAPGAAQTARAAGSAGSAGSAVTDEAGAAGEAGSAGIAAAGPSAVGEPAWHWPVDPPWTIVRPFEAPATRYAAGHRGIDIAATRGAAVYAPADGTVRFSARVVDRPVITLEHAGDLLSSMEPVSGSLEPGTFVRRGERIGTVAGGGHCDGSCLHLGVRLHGDYVSPMLYLGSVPRAVLLPLR